MAWAPWRERYRPKKHELMALYPPDTLVPDASTTLEGALALQQRYPGAYCGLHRKPLVAALQAGTHGDLIAMHWPHEARQWVDALVRLDEQPAAQGDVAVVRRVRLAAAKQGLSPSEYVRRHCSVKDALALMTAM